MSSDALAADIRLSKKDFVMQTEIADLYDVAHHESPMGAPARHSPAARPRRGHPTSASHGAGQRPLEVVFQNICVSVQLKSSGTSLGSICEPLKSKLGRHAGQPILPTTTPAPSAGEKRILSDMSGYARPGQMLGIMGPSGSGKTTLLSALSGRQKATSGRITLNGETLNKQLRRKICYVLQQDIFFPDLTLRQTLSYTALLRLPDSMSHEQKMRHVDHIIDALDLRQCQHTIIGDMMKRGLSGGEKKRASVACELLTNPAVMLIDEPTSGLDSSSAHTLMQTLKDYAVKERKTMIATVHQPSSQIFHMFDKLLLMCGGRVAFFGDVQDVVPFFSRVGHQISAHYNPADFIMEKVKGTAAEQETIIAAAKALHKSPPQRHHSSQPHPLPILEDEAGGHETQDHDVHTTQSSYQSSAPCDDTATAAAQSKLDDHESQEPSENNPLWTGYDHPDGHCDLGHERDGEKDLHVVIEQSDKIQKVYNKVVMNDDDSGRSSWTDRSSTTTFSCASSSISSTEEMYFDFTFNSKCPHHSRSQKWPTSFWTQLRVLTQRNFYEARGRMLSKLNWIQTIGLALVSGCIWMQATRTEATLPDIRGWMFFSMTYWMLHALFSALVSFPPEREVINKERASGAYRLSAYYVAKMIGELPLTITLPTAFHVISYPLMGYNNPITFLLLWAFLIMSTVVAQSVGLFIGAACVDLEFSVTISALYSMSSMLFGGYYASSMPAWLSWMRYLSMVFYSFQNMQMVEFEYGPPISCSASNSKFASCHNATAEGASPVNIDYGELRRSLDIMSIGSEPLPVWFNSLVLVAFLLVFRLAGYLVLRYVRKPK